MKWKRVHLSPPWRQDPELWTDLLSPDRLWHLSVFGYDDDSINFQAYLEISDLYYHILSTGTEREPADVDYARGLIKTPKHISAISREDAVAKSIDWANQKILEFNDRIFTSNFGSSARPRLNSLFEKGSKEAKSYIKSYFKKLENRLISGTKTEKHKALNSIIFILGLYPNWRPLLPEKLHVIVDELETRGILITDVDIDPERLVSIRTKNPKKASDPTSLIDKCRKLWDQYCYKPTKKNLRKVIDHLEVMKISNSENVKKERARCLRAANREAKRLKLVK